MSFDHFPIPQQRSEWGRQNRGAPMLDGGRCFHCPAKAEAPAIAERPLSQADGKAPRVMASARRVIRMIPTTAVSAR